MRGKTLLLVETSCLDAGRTRLAHGAVNSATLANRGMSREKKKLQVLRVSFAAPDLETLLYETTEPLQVLCTWCEDRQLPVDKTLAMPPCPLLTAFEDAARNGKSLCSEDEWLDFKTAIGGLVSTTS